MGRQTSSIALVASAVCSALLAAGPAVAAPQGSCKAVDVVGTSVQQARAALARNGCKPGSVRDGRHFLVKAQCADAESFGLVISQSVTGRRLGKDELLVLTKGVRTTSDGKPCPAGDPAQQSPELARLDGSYVGSLTVTEDPAIGSTNAVGYTWGGFKFTVANGKISGDVDGTVAWGTPAGGGTAVITNGGIHIGVYRCSGTLTFVVGPDGRVKVTSPRVVCPVTQGNLVGTYAAST